MSTKTYYVRSKPYKVQQSPHVLLTLTPKALSALQFLQNIAQEAEKRKVKTETIVNRLLENLY